MKPIMLLVCLSALAIAPARAQGSTAAAWGCDEHVVAFAHDSLDYALMEPRDRDRLQAADQATHDSAFLRLFRVPNLTAAQLDSMQQITQELNNAFASTRYVLLREPVPTPGMDACNVLLFRGLPDRVTRLQTAAGHMEARWWYSVADQEHMLVLVPAMHGHWIVETVVW